MDCAVSEWEASHPGPPKLLLRRPGPLSTPEAVTQVDTHADLVATVLGDTQSVAGSVPDISGEEDSPVEEEVTQSPGSRVHHQSVRNEVPPCLPLRKASVRHEVCVARSTEGS